MASVAVLLRDVSIADAFAYRGLLYCWTLDSQLQVYKIEALVSALERQYGDVGLAAAYALFSSRGIGSTSAMRHAFEEYKSVSAPSETLKIQADPESVITFAQAFEFVLDIRLYYNHIYIATERGTFVAHALKEVLEDRSRVDLETLQESHVYSLSTGLRAVASSLGKSGLFISTNVPNRELGRSARIHLPVPSIRSSISSSWIVNHPSDDEYQLYRPTVANGDQASDITLVAIDNAHAQMYAGENDTPGGYVVWDGLYQRLITASASELTAFRPDTGRRSRSVGGYLRLDSEPLSVSITGNRYVVVETAGDVVLVRDHQEQRFETGPCLSVRTYRWSWRYRRLVTCSSADGLWMIAAYASHDHG